MAIVLYLLLLILPQFDCELIETKIEKAKILVNQSRYQEALNQLYSVKGESDYCDEKSKLALWHQLAVIHLYGNKKDSAIYYTKKTLQNSFKVGNDSIRIKSLTNLGMLLNQTNQYSEAIDHYREVWKYYNYNPTAKENPNNDFKIAIAASNLALTHLNLNNQDSALFYINKSFDFKIKESNLGFVQYNFNLASEIYENKGDIVKAVAYSDSSLTLAKTQNNIKQIQISTARLMNLSLLLNDLKRASLYENEVIDAVNRNDEIIFKKRFLSVLYRYYKASNQNLKALQTVENINSINDSITKIDYEAKILGLNSEYNAIKLENQNLEYQITIKNSQQKNLYLIIGLVLAITLLIVITLRFRFQRLKMNTYFNHQKEFKQFYKYLKSQKTNNVEQPENTLFLKLLHEINENKLHLDPNIKSKDIARIIGTNTKYLSNAVNKSYGKSISHLLNFYRIEEAKEKLERLSEINEKINGSVSNLWEECGFNSNVHFYRVFKKFSGLTPSEYHTLSKKHKKRQPRRTT